jgi:two-component system chemotaxis response regulator CheB
MPESSRDIVVIGTSLGGFDALRRLTAEIPKGFPGSLFVVQHVGPDAPSLLDRLLERNSKLPVRWAKNREAFAPGIVYLAPPDRHLLFEDGMLRINRGPRENGFRPSIDVLFRSAAATHGSRVIGVVLSGLLDDGAAGLLAVHRAGGVTVVQHPEDAQFGEMPLSALMHGPIDHTLPIAEIPALLEELVGSAAPPVQPPDDLVREASISASYADALPELEQLGTRTLFTCPGCSGALWEVGREGVPYFRCHIGHGYSLPALRRGQKLDVERALLVALRTFEQRLRILERRTDGDWRDPARRVEERKQMRRHAETIRELLRTMH